MSNGKYMYIAYATVAYYDGLTTAIIGLFDEKKAAIQAALDDARTTFTDNMDFDLTEDELEERMSEAGEAIEKYGDYEFKDWDAVDRGADSGDLGYYLFGIEKKQYKGKKLVPADNE